MQTDTLEAPTSAALTLTPAAVAKAIELRDRDGGAELMLRVQVSPGGCSGLSYGISLDNRRIDGDTYLTFDSLTVALDQASAPYLSTAVIDFLDTIQESGFSINNPAATASCACGDSFACG